MPRHINSEFPANIRPWLSNVPLLACVVLFLIHFSTIWKYAVNIPAWDDWTLFNGDHPATLSWQWLFELANEHRTSTTKLFVWLQYRLNYWDLRTHQIIDFLIYGLFLILIVRF